LEKEGRKDYHHERQLEHCWYHITQRKHNYTVAFLSVYKIGKFTESHFAKTTPSADSHVTVIMYLQP